MNNMIAYALETIDLRNIVDKQDAIALFEKHHKFVKKLQ